ncbi:hypothetical protein PQE75_gp187 [Bacillus phage vB_BcoS-136]|uniref:Uncharacterized protein n=1 Tax=Bacillus phage vB_BcoS-136 TaxID=2419619 RepID=A0A3G3BVJ7_9CAUD|nr:hypothetical protein PQE75_gp187 [Bacillus phage vB_BcoS-136]AYP68292.1 hypothetical protein vBBcoS136_00178 [Bacillus phage vB_BcoS-136]
MNRDFLERIKIVGTNDDVQSFFKFLDEISNKITELKEQYIQMENQGEKFDICVDDDNVDILDYIHSHFQGDNWDKNFEVSIKLREFFYNEDGKRVYID